MNDDKFMDLMIKTTQGTIWQCPKCLGFVGKQINPQRSAVPGSASASYRCSNCGTSYSAVEVDGGKLDATYTSLRWVFEKDEIENGKDLLIKFLANKNNDASRRAEIALALGKIGGDPCAEALISASKDEDEVIRTSAEQALSILRSQESKK